MTHKPILHIYQDGSEFFAAHLDFVDLQASPVVWFKTGVVPDLLRELESDADPLTNEVGVDSKGDE